MLDKRASRQRVKIARGKFVEKEDFNILYVQRNLPFSLVISGKADIRAFRVVRSFAEISSAWIASVAMFLQECLQDQAEQKVRDTR